MKDQFCNIMLSYTVIICILMNNYYYLKIKKNKTFFKFLVLYFATTTCINEICLNEDPIVTLFLVNNNNYISDAVKKRSTANYQTKYLHKRGNI